MERDTFSSKEEAERRATEMGCTGSHQITLPDGRVVWKPCTDEYEHLLYNTAPVPADPSLAMPADNSGTSIVSGDTEGRRSAGGSTQTKVGRVLSQANVERLQQIRDSLASMQNLNLPGTLQQLVERATNDLNELLAVGNPVVDDDPQPKSHQANQKSYEERLEDAQALVLEMTSAKALRGFRNALNAVIRVAEANDQATKLRKMLRRQ